MSGYEIRLREEGEACVGEIFVVTREPVLDLTGKIEELAERARALDWRLYDLVVMPVKALRALGAKRR